MFSFGGCCFVSNVKLFLQESSDVLRHGYRRLYSIGIYSFTKKQSNHILTSFCGIELGDQCTPRVLEKKSVCLTLRYHQILPLLSSSSCFRWGKELVSFVLISTNPFVGGSIRSKLPPQTLQNEASFQHLGLTS
jgi:hypothetical protein